MKAPEEWRYWLYSNLNKGPSLFDQTVAGKVVLLTKDDKKDDKRMTRNRKDPTFQPGSWAKVALNFEIKLGRTGVLESASMPLKSRIFEPAAVYCRCES
jgi:hypothetical protein